MFFFWVLLNQRREARVCMREPRHGLPSTTEYLLKARFTSHSFMSLRPSGNRQTYEYQIRMVMKNANAYKQMISIEENIKIIF